jgi:predicted CoA-substrate-specific enzyme activase
LALTEIFGLKPEFVGITEQALICINRKLVNCKEKVGYLLSLKNFNMTNEPSKQTNEKNSMYLGLDVGSVSVNTVLLNSRFDVIEEYYDFTQGKPFHVLQDRIKSIFERVAPESISYIAITGTGGKLATDFIGGVYVNEIISNGTSVGALFPEAQTLIEIGGEDSKLILLEKDPADGRSKLVDFEMNSICAAGTGSFLDQQAKRIGVSIEKEFGDMALKSEHPPRIAGRCSVFAKSDMIHLQQIATPLHDIVAGLCFAMARNFRSTVARSKDLKKPIVFAGGVAANLGMVRAFKDVLKLQDGELIIPKHHASMGAIGAVMYGVNNAIPSEGFKGLDELQKYLESSGMSTTSLPKLIESEAKYFKSTQFKKNGHPKLPVYLGLDIGSLSTNVVLIDDDHNVVARRYIPTAGKPLEAIQRGLTEIYEEVGEHIEVVGAGTTGSGRYLTGDFIGADTIVNEITAQATAAIDYDSTVDTIFEIGGQDSKYICIENGVVVDFEMNKVCAAGTGSFLEEQAEKLNINIIKEFGDRALQSDCPVKLGDRCTVFMESDLNTCMQRGVATDNLVGGLAYSIVYNYMQKLVGTRKVGNKIFFQGGVTNNKAVVAAFEQVTGKKIIIPPHFDVTGAIGSAILAKRNMQEGQKTKFKGFDVRNVPYDISVFVCNSCTNHCDIRRVKIQGETKALFYGGRCEKYETSDRKRIANNIPNLIEKRLELLIGDHKDKQEKGKVTIGIPRALMIFYQQFPFWRTFFKELDFNVVVSKESDRQLVTRSLESISIETCLPVELMHGHVLDLAERNVDYIFIPFIVDAKVKEGNPTANCNCPWVQSYPFMIKSALRGKVPEEKLLIPTLHFKYFKHTLNKELAAFFKEKFGISKSKINLAIQKADAAQISFESSLVEIGKQALDNLPKNARTLVMLGRPYNSADPYLNLGLVEKLIGQNIFPIPVDFLPLQFDEVFKDYRSMYWPNGQKIMAAAKLVAKDDRLYAMYLSNFRCGPDSFLAHYVSEEMKGKPYLNLEVDEHSADAGMITRIEAFMDSLKGAEKNKKQDETSYRPRPGKSSPDKQRVLYFPYMNDNAHAISAAARSCGVPSEVLPMQTEEDLALGRKYTSSRECFPMICTTGNFLKKLMEPGVDPAKVSFFMPDHTGPCRFGHYNHLQRVIFDRLGFEKAEILTPTNESSYADIVGANAQKFRINAWKGFVSVDFLRKLLQETKPYEINKGDAQIVYEKSLDKVIKCIESGAKGLNRVLEEVTADFMKVPVDKSHRKPVVAVIGEIFMRDNAFCNGGIVQRLEALGVETLIAPFSEWITYSTYRYTRDSIWKRDVKGYLKSKIQKIAQEFSHHQLLKNVLDKVDHEKDVNIKDMLSLCNPYVNKDYDGDPPIAMGTAMYLANKGISGIAAILPFTCMPGTLVASVSDSFRKDHNNMPWINIAYDGQDSVSIETRLQAFAHQVKEFTKAGKVIETV